MSSINNTLWVLMMGMLLEIAILIFIVVFVISFRIWTSKKYNQCFDKINEIEQKFMFMDKVDNGLADIRKQNEEIVNNLKQLLK